MIINWRGMITSPKFWIAVIGVITAGVLYVQGFATVEQLATGLTGLAVIILGWINYEQQNEIRSLNATVKGIKE